MHRNREKNPQLKPLHIGKIVGKRSKKLCSSPALANIKDCKYLIYYVKEFMESDLYIYDWSVDEKSTVFEEFDKSFHNIYSNHLFINLSFMQHYYDRYFIFRFFNIQYFIDFTYFNYTDLLSISF